MLREVCGETMKSNFTSTVVDADSTQIKEFLTRVSQGKDKEKRSGWKKSDAKLKLDINSFRYLNRATK